MNEEPSQWRIAAAQRRLSAAFVVSGAALVLYVLTPLPLPIALLVAGVAAVAVIRALAVPEVPVGEWTGATVVRAGLIASVPALLAYDLSRLALKTLGGFEVGPFEALPHFGRALLGEGVGPGVALFAGAGLHVVNAVGFSVAFALLLRDRGIAWGIGWGLFLEAFMLAIYPRWLQIVQLGEFATLSMVGHICYGSVLGASTRALLRRANPRAGETVQPIGPPEPTPR